MGKPKLGAGAKIAGLIAGVAALALTGCGQGSTPPVTSSGPATAAPTNLPSAIPASSDPMGDADVIKVSVSGGPGAYSLSVTVQSPDTGCGSYADWWEVVSEDEELLYRRVLLHSHVAEQPFTRSGGPVNIQPSDTVIIRAHMNRAGYGGEAFGGTVADGFSPAGVFPDFAAGLESQKPLPTDCAF